MTDTQQLAELVADLIASKLADSQQLAYSPQKAAEVCDVPLSTIRNAISSGKLRAKRTGRQYTISREALRKWLSC